MLSLRVELILPGANVFNLLRNYSEELLMVDLSAWLVRSGKALRSLLPRLANHNSLIFQVLPEHLRTGEAILASIWIDTWVCSIRLP